ncbi:YaaA family protein [Crocosphaera sp. XPORK-15E]|uniref:YaaA family protein n=1 Tax=Crocosphaera sp. XPORK-15E TaxID=3110247 RepID=UPI002B1F6B07|nr:YaaA family protein [Crocosphaera sp. XPORK-15E]MEA5536910.1 YaaA family protein [Crocosphaera sp. XPORK-15E]
MLLILSSAKTLVFDDFFIVPETKTVPIFKEDSNFLVNYIKTFSSKDLGQLLGVSESLATLNYQRFQSFDTAQKQAAILAYRGDVFKQLELDKFKDNDYLFAQEHLRIISGLYGILRPLDEISPYRLEMNTRLQTEKADILYKFWTEKVTQQLNNELEKHQTKILLNLASDEYSRIIKSEHFNYPILKVSFKEIRNSQLKTIGIMAKKSRGIMSNWVIKNKIDEPLKLKNYSGLGYHYDESLSNEQELVFIK